MIASQILRPSLYYKPCTPHSLLLLLPFFHPCYVLQCNTFPMIGIMLHCTYNLAYGNVGRWIWWSPTRQGGHQVGEGHLRSFAKDCFANLTYSYFPNIYYEYLIPLKFQKSLVSISWVSSHDISVQIWKYSLKSFLWFLKTYWWSLASFLLSIQDPLFVISNLWPVISPSFLPIVLYNFAFFTFQNYLNFPQNSLFSLKITLELITVFFGV